MTTRKNVILKFYDAPLWKDWLAYLTVLGLYAGIQTTTQTYSSDQVGSLPFMLDVTFALVFQFVLFGVIPGAIRKAHRSKQAAL